MNKKTAIINITLIFIALFGLKFARPIFFPNFTESIDKKWGIEIPDPAEESKIESSKEGNNSEKSLYRLTYNSESDLEKIKTSFNWVFKDDTGEFIPVDIMEVIESDNENSRYFYKREKDDMIALSLDSNVLTVYQTYK